MDWGDRLHLRWFYIYNNPLVSLLRCRLSYCMFESLQEHSISQAMAEWGKPQGCWVPRAQAFFSIPSVILWKTLASKSLKTPTQPRRLRLCPWASSQLKWLEVRQWQVRNSVSRERGADTSLGGSLVVEFSLPALTAKPQWEKTFILLWWVSDANIWQSRLFAIYLN